MRLEDITEHEENDTPLVSVVVATYNQPNALKLTLAGYRVQTFKNFELLLADDGSTPENLELMERELAACPFPTRLVTHEDKGFRKVRIVNKTVSAARGELLVFVDGDTIPARNFLQEHTRVLTPTGFNVGGFVRLSLEASRSLSVQDVLEGRHETYLNLAHRVYFWKRHIDSLYYILVGRIDRPKCYGRNMAVGRRAFEVVNGYDENHIDIIKEDSDLRNRLRRSRARANCVWHRAISFHLDHELDRPPGFTISIDKKRQYDYYHSDPHPIRAEKGLDQHRTN